MNRLAPCCLAVLLATASPAAAQRTRTFPDAQCSYTLPGADWEWLNPGALPHLGGKNIAFARNRSGMSFVLMFLRLEPGEKVQSNAYESYEIGFFRSSPGKKLGSRHLSFKTVPSYQLEVQLPKGHCSAVRVLYANERFYYLQVNKAFGPLGPESETEPLFQGFDFLGQPRPMLSPPDDGSARRGKAVGEAMGALVTLGVGGLLAGGVVLAVLLLSNRRKTARRDRDDWDDRAPRRRRWREE
jgi:hypothetical protein